MLLEVQGLRCGYAQAPVLHGVDLTVARGELVGVLGHNGMGKTTLLKTLMGFIRPSAGRVLYDAMDVTRLSTHRRNRLGMGYVPQGRGIFARLSVRENLRMGVLQRKQSEVDALDEIFAEFPRLVPLAERRGGALSGGEQQLLALARCLAGNPRMLLLDEPTEGIQPSIIDEIEATLRSLRERRGLTIILVEQNLDFITTLADRVLLLQKGQIVQEVPGERLHEPEIFDEFAGFGAAPSTPAGS